MAGIALIFGICLFGAKANTCAKLYQKRLRRGGDHGTWPNIGYTLYLNKINIK